MACSPAMWAGLDALSSIVGLVFMMIGLVCIPSDSSEDEPSVRALLITEIVLFTIQLLQTFVHYYAGISKTGSAAVFWLFISIPLLVAQLVVVIIAVTVANGEVINLFAIAFLISFIFKVPQIFNMLRFTVKKANFDTN